MPSKPLTTRDHLIAMQQAGLTQTYIAGELGCSQANVSYQTKQERPRVNVAFAAGVMRLFKKHYRQIRQHQSRK